MVMIMVMVMVMVYTDNGDGNGSSTVVIVIEYNGSNVLRGVKADGCHGTLTGTSSALI
jgi:hypothetical protein